MKRLPPEVLADWPDVDWSIEASWERVFDLESDIEGVTDEAGQRCVQATLWSVPARAVRGIACFVAR